MKIRKSVWLAVPCFVLLAGCPKEDETETAPPPATTAAPTAAPTPTPTQLQPQTPPPAAAGAKVKAEIDGRSDGISGTPMAAAGAKATVPTPAGWAAAKSGDFSTATSADKKASLAAAGAGTDKLEAGATALGLTGCTWNAGEPVTVGKDKLSGTAADGTCQKGGASVQAAYVALSNENLLVIGAYEQGGDSGNVFGAMRGIAKAGTGGDPSGVSACCAAIRQNSKSAPLDQQGMYIAAAAACDALKNNPQGKAGLGQLAGILRGAGLPPACK
jgi:hypothetical protein